jgi:uncharacterized Zn-binding protein involved in type VI secretion
MSERQKDETTYLFATIGSRTARGGRVSRVTTKAEAQGLALARVGDMVTYEDGSEATIIDGAGFAAQWCGVPFALVGSCLDNGDTIVETLQDFWGVSDRADKPIHGLFDPAYVSIPAGAVDAGSGHA